MKVNIYEDELFPYYNAFIVDGDKGIDWPINLSWGEYSHVCNTFFEWQDRLKPLCNV